MTTETITPAAPAAPAAPATSEAPAVSAPANIEAPKTEPGTSPVTVNVSLGDLVAKALNPETPAAGAPTVATPPAVVVAEPPKAEAPVEEPKGATKAELRAQVAKLEGEKRCAAVLEALRPKLAQGMDAVVKGLLPTLDLSTDDAVKAAVEQLSKDMPALFAEPGAAKSQPNTNTAIFNLPAAGNTPVAPVMRRNR